MENIVDHSQRVQTQSRAAQSQDQAKRKARRRARIKRALAECGRRLALSPFEFGHAMGRSETWAYRQIYSGTVKAISDDGMRLLIPKSEIDRFLERAHEYNPQHKERSDSGCKITSTTRGGTDERREPN